MTVEKIEEAKVNDVNQEEQPKQQDWEVKFNQLQEELATERKEKENIKNWIATVKEEKRVAVEKARQAALNAETKTKEEADSIIAQYKQEVADRDAKLAEIAKEKQQNLLDEKARELAQSLTQHPGRQKSLTREIKDRIRLSEDGTVQVLDKKGNLTISSVDVLVNDLKKDFDFLVDGVKSTGGGGHSSEASANTKDFKDMNSNEKVELAKKDPERYEQMLAAWQKENKIF